MERTRGENNPRRKGVGIKKTMHAKWFIYLRDKRIRSTMQRAETVRSIHLRVKLTEGKSNIGQLRRKYSGSTESWERQRCDKNKAKPRNCHRIEKKESSRKPNEKGPRSATSRKHQRREKAEAQGNRKYNTKGGLGSGGEQAEIV